MEPILFDERVINRTRRDGNTTRLVDQYVQELFAAPGRMIAVPDHWNSGGHYHANMHLVKILKNRLIREHGFNTHHLPVEWHGAVPHIMLAI